MNTITLTASSRNQNTYQQLSQAIQLGLRRQVFFVVCDNLDLRERLVNQLQKDVSLTEHSLATLYLNPESPNLFKQLAEQLRQYSLYSSTIPSSVQILGIECLTKQSANLQHQFLKSLQTLYQYLPQSSLNLIFWLPRPWLYTIEDSVPQLWQSYTGLFEFEGEPTPIILMKIPQPESQFSFPQETLQVLENAVSSLPLKGGEEDSIEEEKQVLSVLEDSIDNPSEMADLLLQLGEQYRDLVATGKSGLENVQLGIQAYEQGLQWLGEDHPKLPEILNDLANLYWMLSRQVGDANLAVQSLEASIETYESAMSHLVDRTEDYNPIYSMLKNNLGAVYSDLARYRDPMENLQKSILYYEESLKYRQPEQDAVKYGSTQNNLGTAYWHLAQYESPVAHLKASITSYQQALTQYHPEQEPLNWAMIQNNLGTAYWNLSQYENSAFWLDCAINAYKHALQFRNPEIAPSACAVTQNNLGTAYCNLAECLENDTQKQKYYLQEGISAYEIAIQLGETLQQQGQRVNFEMNTTLNNLGLIYYKLATQSALGVTDTKKQSYLEKGFNIYLKILRLVNKEEELYQTAFNYLVSLVRIFYQEGGSNGQNLALSKIPSALLPDILTKL